MKGTVPRILLLAPAGLVAAGLLWWLAERGGGKDAVVVVKASPPEVREVPLVMRGTPASAEVERRILDSIGEPGTRIRDVHIVDRERQIACGKRVDGDSATPRRFVWLSQLHQVVTDDGGQDFAILVHVCNPPPSL